MTDRPVYMNLIRIRLPVTGVVSFAQRISGALLFLSIPAAVYLLDRSVASESGFRDIITMAGHPAAMALQLVLVWSLAHHVIAGFRFLLIDFDIGVEKRASRAGAYLVMLLELIVVAAFIAGAWL